MEIKKVLEELKMVNEINTLPLEELESKYLKDEETYNKFSKQYFDYFKNHIMYQLRVGNHYDKIANLYLSGADQYPSEENDTTRFDILEIMAYNNEKYHLKNNDYSCRYQAESVFLGIFDHIFPKEYNYELLLLGIEEGAKKYDSANSSVRGFIKNVPKRIQNVAKRKEDVQSIIDDYVMTNHDSISLCNDLSFLFFANYMLHCKPNMVDSNFRRDVSSVIKASFLLQHLNYYNEQTLDKDLYNKLAKHTLKSLDQQEKKEKKEIKEETETVRKAKRYFTNLCKR